MGDDKDIYQLIAENKASPEAVIEKIEEAENEGDYIAAFDLASMADYNGIADFSDRLAALREKINEMQRKLLESAPLGDLRVGYGLLFTSVCCQEMKDAVLAGKMGAIIVDCMTCTPSLYTESPDIYRVATGEDYQEGDYCELCDCPFCGKELRDD